MKSADLSLREQLARRLEWEDAHVGYDAAVAKLAAKLRGVRPPGLPHSAWELIEHLRITQRDILDFCIAGEYHELEWPKQYWPSSAAPGSAKDWDASIAAFRRDRAELKRMALDADINLLD